VRVTTPPDLHPHGHFRTGTVAPEPSLHEAEIGGAFVLARIVIVRRRPEPGPTVRSTRTQGNNQALIRPLRRLRISIQTFPPSHFWLRRAHGALRSISSPSEQHDYWAGNGYRRKNDFTVAEDGKPADRTSHSHLTHKPLHPLGRA